MSRPNPPHIHTPDDGRSMHRSVLLNGKPITHVVYADTKRGIVRVLRQPIQPDKYRKRALTKTLHGKVEVVEGATSG